MQLSAPSAHPKASSVTDGRGVAAGGDYVFTMYASAAIRQLAQGHPCG
jgi:hypothetical protein